MKHVFTLVILAAFALTATAQTFVSTTPANKDVLLVDYGGIYCTFCPDGHVVADGIAAANPGRVNIISVHTGSFAAPSGNDADLRVPVGAAWGGQTGLTGYPAGTVNRTNFPGLEQGNPGTTAMSRGDWSNASTQILGQSSPVNVAAQSSIDVGTRTLTVVVEAYYTGNSTVATNKLNVALLQDNIVTAQTGASSNPSAVVPGGYNQTHVLRGTLTGDWGVDINTTTAGHFETQTFTYTIPAVIGNVPVELGDLSVVVFIAEDQQTVTTAAHSTMSYVLPPGTAIADLETTSGAVAPSGYCDYNFTPTVDVTNTSMEEIDTFSVSYAVNGGTPVSQLITQKLSPNQTTTVSFAATTLGGGGNEISYMTDFATYNYNLIDFTSGNNTISEGPYYLLNPTAAGTSLVEGFNGLSPFDPAPSTAIAVNPDAISAFYIDNTAVNGLSWNLGGFGNSNGCFMWDFYTIDAGDNSSLVFQKYDFSNHVNASLSFSHAYAQYTSENDRLEVLASDDCGATWTSVFDKAGDALETSGTSTNRFFPDVNEWTANSVDLSAFDGKSEVVVMFRGTSDFGNALYVDDINTSFPVNTNNVVEFANIKVFPNPTSGDLNVQIALEEAIDMNVEVTNALGQVVKQIETGNYVAGQHDIKFGTDDLANGTYFVVLRNANAVVTKRFVVMH